MTDTSTEAIRSLVSLINHNEVYEKLEDVDVEAYRQSKAVIRALAAERDALQAKLDEAVGALEPFAEAANRIDYYDGDQFQARLYALRKSYEAMRELLYYSDPLAVRHLRNARAALASIKGDDE